MRVDFSTFRLSRFLLLPIESFEILTSCSLTEIKSIDIFTNRIVRKRSIITLERKRSQEIHFSKREAGQLTRRDTTMIN